MSARPSKRVFLLDALCRHAGTCPRAQFTPHAAGNTNNFDNTSSFFNQPPALTSL
ncbi:hypothetical protein B0H14DRAFT_3458604 [Mycena olivaceomarginata]|nr:hypothetical protein B0H14DRAFT_3458604 [Mycena olivaceomarginata]